MTKKRKNKVVGICFAIILVLATPYQSNIKAQDYIFNPPPQIVPVIYTDSRYETVNALYKDIRYYTTFSSPNRSGFANYERLRLISGELCYKQNPAVYSIDTYYIYELGNTTPIATAGPGRDESQRVHLGIKLADLDPNKVYILEEQCVFTESRSTNRFLNMFTVTADAVAPSLTVPPLPTGWQKGPLTLNIMASDDYPGLKTLTITNLTSETFTDLQSSINKNYTVSRNGVYNISTGDAHGNITTSSVTVTNLDYTKPKVTVTLS